jgi:hypothetical protein
MIREYLLSQGEGNASITWRDEARSKKVGVTPLSVDYGMNFASRGVR